MQAVQPRLSYIWRSLTAAAVARTALLPVAVVLLLVLLMLLMLLVLLVLVSRLRRPQLRLRLQRWHHLRSVHGSPRAFHSNHAAWRCPRHRYHSYRR